MVESYFIFIISYFCVYLYILRTFDENILLKYESFSNTHNLIKCSSATTNYVLFIKGK